MVNGAEVAPAAIVMVDGTEAAAEELFSDTATPVEGAGALRVTVFAVLLVPPVIVEGNRAMEESATGRRVSVTVFVVEPQVAEIVTDVDAETGLV